MEKSIIRALLVFLVIGCTNGKQENTTALNVGDSITTIEGVTYYWQQFAEDSAWVNAVKDGKVTQQCLITGPVHGAVPAENEQYSDRFFFILCGEDQYAPFDTQNIPVENNLMTEEEFENYDIEDEDADFIFDVE